MPYMFDPQFFHAGLRRVPIGSLLGFPWAIPPLGNPNLEGNLKEKLACINPTAGHAAPAQPP